jgi:MRN-interacting protein
MQEFQIVRCVECKLFQVDIVKKVNKWSCKVCNIKQSLKKVYFKSSAANHCREKVQEMNEKFHQTQEAENDALLHEFEDNETQNYTPANCQTRPSVWAKFAKRDEKIVQNSAVTEDPKLATASNKYHYISSFKTPAAVSSGYSIYHQPRPAPLPKLTVIQHDGPSQKKLKLTEDEEDFTISQEDLNFIDSLH